MGSLIQFHGIAVVVIDTTQNDIDLFKPFNCLDPHVSVPCNKIIALSESESHMRCQEGMLEISFISGAGCKQDDAWLVFTLWCYVQEGLHHTVEEAAELRHIMILEQLRHYTREGTPVFKGITHPGRCL